MSELLNNESNIDTRELQYQHPITDIDLTNQLNEYVENTELKKIPKFTFNGLQTLVKVVRILDGDTIECVFKFNLKFYKYIFRLSGIDAPEIKSKTKK